MNEVLVLGSWWYNGVALSVWDAADAITSRNDAERLWRYFMDPHGFAINSHTWEARSVIEDSLRWDR